MSHRNCREWVVTNSVVTDGVIPTKSDGEFMWHICSDEGAPLHLQSCPLQRPIVATNARRRQRARKLKETCVCVCVCVCACVQFRFYLEYSILGAWVGQYLLTFFLAMNSTSRSSSPKIFNDFSNFSIVRTEVADFMLVYYANSEHIG